MIKTGLLSVTFRKTASREIVHLTTRAGLHGIEWGGDVHVPHGDLAAARDARRMTEDAGLAVLAYGSYFRCRPGEAFEPVLASAVALGAPMIRIWAGERGSAEVDEVHREAVAGLARACVASASQAGIAVAFEHHANTLTDTLPSTLALLHATPGARTLWQPPHNMDEDARLEGLRRMLPSLANIHVFHWRMPDLARLPLCEGEVLWRKRLHVAADGGRDFAALLEFVRGDSPEQMVEDAATLRRCIEMRSGLTEIV